MDTKTAEEENVSNSLEENTTALMNNVVKKQQQSYENFVSNFTYLTHDDIIKSEEKKLLKKDKMADVSNRKHLNNMNDTSTSTKLELPNVTNEDELEEEVLGEDIKIEIGEEEEGSNKSKRNFTKFDNFVDNEDVDNEDNNDDDDSDIGSGYLASFHESNLNAENENLKVTDFSKQQTQNESPQNIVNEESVPKKPMEPEIKSSDLDCDIRIAECPFQPDENGFLLNPGEAEREITPTDVSSIQHTTYLEYSCTYAKSDEKEAIIKSDEIVEVDTLLSSDEVEEFKLDENFDYDNIVLTPKYTQQEMNYFNSFRENNEKSS